MVLKLSQLVYRSMLKNMKSYYLYFFSLIFSVTLYFSFKTLRYNDEVTEQLKEGSSASTGFEVTTYLLYFIILVFVLYANQIFMKRRSKEIGLYQLIGMSKGLIFRLIAIENVVLFGGAVVIGIGIGFLTSRLFAMILLKLIGSNYVLGISFSIQSAIITLAIFAVMLIIILVQLYFIIRKHTLLEMFHAANKADESVRKFSVLHMLMGLVGLGLIIYGYHLSTILFAGTDSGLGNRMIIVLGTTILGTYFIFRYSVALIINVWRRTRKGFLSRSDVVALSPIMHRMKSSASSLTLIAVLTAISLGVNTLSYISYYTVDKMTVQTVPSDFVVINGKEDEFTNALEDANIAYDKVVYNYLEVASDISGLLNNKEDVNNVGYDISDMSRIIPASIAGETLQGDEVIVANFNTYTTQLLDFEANQSIMVGYSVPLNVIELDENSILLSGYGLSLYPVIIVSDEMFETLNAMKDVVYPKTEVHVNLQEGSDFEEANELYKQTEANVREVLPNGVVRLIMGQKELQQTQFESLGLTIFVTAFLGLAFLLASGSILYFKQMTEADMESASYTVLRKIGYSEQDLMHGVYRKQLFNFGVPIIVGLLHSYFAVKSGWWFFGTEYATPMAIMMVVYVTLYIFFAILTVRYYRLVVRKAL
jgi:bacitracin transport system permease protein